MSTHVSGRRFAVTYAIIAGGIFAVYVFPFELFGFRGDWLSGYLSVYARIAGASLSVFEPGISVVGSQINGRFPLQIIRNCDAAEVKILFASAVLAFPAKASRRALALVLGLAGLVVANVTRICCLYVVGANAPSWFRVAHEEIWPFVLVALAATMFIACARYMSADQAASDAR